MELTTKEAGRKSKTVMPISVSPLKPKKKATPRAHAADRFVLRFKYDRGMRRG
jgi:hypothetical protein